MGSPAAPVGAAAGLPLVSVIVPVYNGGRFLAEALDSAFAQGYHPLEVIVVDDGSTDGTAEVAQSYPEVRYLYQENRGVAVARNRAIAAARGDLIAMLDADDLWPPGKLARQISYLLAHPEAGGVIGMVHNYADGTLRVEEIPSVSDRVGLQTLVVRREVYDRVGTYDPTYRVASDMDWTQRARDAGVLIPMLPDILVYRRVHGDNLSHQADARVANMLRMFKASIDRKRQESR